MDLPPPRWLLRALVLMAVAASLALPLCTRATPVVATAGAPTLPTNAAYQRHFQFLRIDSSNGLAQNSVSLLYQDRRGYMWMATQGGLFRYDGYSLRRYSHDPSRVASLPDDFLVTALADADDGHLWVGTSSGGLILFDPTVGSVLPLPSDVRRRNLPINDVLRLPDASVLVATRAGLDRLQRAPSPHLQSLWREPAGASDGVRALTRCPDGQVFAHAGEILLAVGERSARALATRADAPIDALFCDAHNRLLLGDAQGLWQVNRRSGQRTPLWQAVGNPVGVVAIVADHSGRIWLGLADHSLLRLGPNGAQTRVLPAPLGIAGGLPDSRIETLLVDRTGLLWVGTASAGAARTLPDGNPIQAVLDLTGNPRTPTFVRAFYPAPDGQYWVALNGPGLVRYDPATGTVTRYGDILAKAIATQTQASTRPHSRLSRRLASFDTGLLHIYAIVPDGHGGLLLPSNRGVLRYDPTSGVAAYLTVDGSPFTTPARALLRARNGDLWISALDAGLLKVHAGHLVQRYDRAHGLAANMVFALAQDAVGNIWVGTSEGVSRIDAKTGVPRTFREFPGRPDSLAGQTVASLLVTRTGELWVGSLSGISRLQRIDAQGAHFKRYGTSSGLPDDTIDCMLEDTRGDIWFSTNLGIGRLAPRNGTVRTFGTEDGLQGNEYNSGACLAAPDGKLLFGGRGFDIIDPARVRRSSMAPPVVFTNVYAGKQMVAARDSVTLPAGHRAFYAAWAALDFRSPEATRYRYRLLGRSAAWSTPSADRSVAYASLAPGDYRLEVQSMLRDGSPGQTATLAIHAETAWWATRAMQVLYSVVAALLLLLATLVWRRQRRTTVRHRQQLRLRESRLRHALWGSGDEFWDLNVEEGTILRLGPAGQPGGHREDSIPLDAWRTTMVHPDDLGKVDHALAEHLAGHTEHFEVEHRVRGPGNTWNWILSRGRTVERDVAGKALRVCGTSRDVSATRAADRDRRIAAEVIRNMTEAVIVTDVESRFFSVNTAFTRMTGYAEHEVIGRDATLLNGSRHHADDSLQQLHTALADAGHWRGELWQRRKDGEEFLCWVEWSEVCDDGGRRTHLIGVLTDITERKRAEQELRYLANYDTLTGLPNRALLGERLGAAVIGARRNGRKVGLLFLDLDRFKHVNDSLGHTAGDRTLKAAGGRLRQCVQEHDVVARLGGDEFTIVLENLADVAGAEAVARRLIQAFTHPLQVSGVQETVLSPSIGIALYPDHGQTPAELLQCADTAMYQAKASGRNTWAVYHAGMDARARNHATLVNALRRALDRNELRLVYQPKMALADDTITGMEALLRWRHPELGEIPPTVFIPLAEETGQIHEISAWVFSTACVDLRRFRAGGHRHLRMAINLSAAQLNRSDLTTHICDLLAEHDVAPNEVELELTESMVMANAEQSVRMLGELKSIGAYLAIDDFGTGYSSLAYLKRLPIDTLKIDQEFVGDITTDPNDAAITSTIITLAHALQVRVVAEGVETAEQLAFLRAQGCDEIQGYWLSRPLDAQACLEFLDHHVAAGAVG